METNLAAFIRDTPEGREADSILRACVHCGFCTATCPTYQLLGDELDGPRGRIYLMKQVLEGATPTETTQLHLDRCLTCRACETTCPSGVQYGRLVDIGRKIVDERVGRKPLDAARRYSLRKALLSKSMFNTALAVGRFFGRKLIQHHLHHALGAARERIWIEAAYFIPNRALRGALKRAARRGVDVRVLMPRNMDVPGLAHASRYTWASLLKAGVKLFEWLPGMLHAKTISIDGVWSLVGSYNLDSRSLVYNWEVSLEVLDPAVAGALDQKYREDLEKSEPIDPSRWRKRGLLQKLRERFFYFFRVWL